MQCNASWLGWGISFVCELLLFIAFAGHAGPGWGVWRRGGQTKRPPPQNNPPSVTNPLDVL